VAQINERYMMMMIFGVESHSSILLSEFELVLGRKNSKLSGRHLPKITSCDLGTKPSYIIQICFTLKIKVSFTQTATLLHPEKFIIYFSTEIFYSLLLTGFEQLLRFPNSNF
jgi:hypothetical protein